MGVLRRAFLLAAVAWLSAFGAAWAKAPSPPARPEQQVLILLRLPPTHFRPNANYSDSYGDGASQAARKRIANRIAQAHGLKLVTGWPMPLLGLDCFVMSVPEGQSPEQVAQALARERAVEWSEPMHVYAAQAGPPNDPLYRAQPVAREWRLDQLRELATGKNVRVAVIDSAVDATQPDLAGQIAARQDFTSGRPGVAETHGTGVAGVIAAVADNQIGIAGVAPGARVMALRACWQQESAATVCDTLSLAKAVHFAVDQRAQVINMSLAGPPDMLLGKLIDSALARGIVVVGAADPAMARGGFPASHPGVVAVTVSGGGGLPGAFGAPGRNVPTTQPGGRFSLVNGSSYSAAHVSGLFALMRERGGKPLTLVTADGGGAIDACATLARGGLACAAPVAYSAAPRP